MVFPLRAGALLVLLGLLVAATAPVGCSGPHPRGAGGRLRVEASFYPLQWAAERVGGDRVEVSVLTKPGAEPHDLELTPREVGAVIDADVVVYLSGFQPSVDEAAKQADASRLFDARTAAKLDRSAPSSGAGEKATETGSASDPHFWLDPTRLAAVVDALAADLADRDPDHARTYRANARAVVADLRSLDRTFEEALGSCRAKDLVTTHSAFDYLARRYGLRQVAISGLSPEDEPSPRALARTARYVREHEVRTIYVEPLASASSADALASETGARIATLDPIEGVDDSSQGDDYLSIMRSNLANLVRGQPCP